MGPASTCTLILADSIQTCMTCCECDSYRSNPALLQAATTTCWWWVKHAGEILHACCFNTIVSCATLNMTQASMLPCLHAILRDPVAEQHVHYLKRWTFYLSIYLWKDEPSIYLSIYLYIYFLYLVSPMTCMHYRNKSLHYIFWLWEQIIYIYKYIWSIHI